MDSSVHKPTAKEVGSWDRHELLKWIQQKKPDLLEDDQLEIFKAAHISGEVFLKHAGDAETFQKNCNLAFGVSETLAMLGTEIAGEETTSVKRNRQDREDAEMSDRDPKKPRRESKIDDKLQELAASARQQRQHIRSEIKRLDQLPVSPSKDVVPPPKDAVLPPKDAVSCPNSVLHLSNPTFDTKLPFPFVGQIIPDRFQVNGKYGESNWFYMGREKFAKLREDFERIRNDPQHSSLTIYGTRGYGKSHLLAALVCYLAAGEEKVVYIPDCREFKKQPVPYIKAAILFAWADDESEQQRIMALNTQEEIDRFFQKQKDVVFAVDQTNALEKEEGDDESTIKKKVELRDWLQGIEATGKAILSSSSNNHAIHNEALRQSSNEVMPVYGGLTENEMKHWWERKQPNLGSYTKDEVEDFTGCIPWFLEKCVVDGTIDLTAPFFSEISLQVWTFEKNIQTQYYKETEVLRLHYDYMKNCLFRLPVMPRSKNISKLVDHRYFYDEPGREPNTFIGKYTCGICRDAVASMILENRVRLDREFALSLPEYVSNPIVTGFTIELAILSHIALNGLNITPELNIPMGVSYFADEVPSFNTTKGKTVLYIPKTFNFPNIDGIIVQIPKSRRRKPELLMYPLQITLQPDKHSNSRVNFFDAWKKWTKSLREFDVVPRFLWITPEDSAIKEYDESSKMPAHTEQYVPISHVSAEIWNWYDEGKRSEQIVHS